MSVRRFSPVPSARTTYTSRNGQPLSFHRNAIQRLSGDHVGDAGAVPMMLGSCATRSTVRPLEVVAVAVCAVADVVAADDAGRDQDDWNDAHLGNHYNPSN